jgi:hypothetical protein
MALRGPALWVAALYVLVAIAAWDPFWMTMDGIRLGIRIVACCTALALVIMGPALLLGGGK